MLFYPLIVMLMVQSSLGYFEEYPTYQESPEAFLYQDDPEYDNDIEVHGRGNNNFLRFGKRDKKYDSDLGEYPEETRPTRSGTGNGNTANSDSFVRFGRNKQDFVRFGRTPQYRVIRDKTNHVRFGRSTDTHKPHGAENKRNKREVNPDKRNKGSEYLRFGRNTNFLRFGRNPSEMTLIRPIAGENQIDDMVQKLQLHHVFNELLFLREELLKCQANNIISNNNIKKSDKINEEQE